MLTLMGRKLTAAEALEGKFSSDGLAALVGEDEGIELAIAKSLAEQSADVAAKEAWPALVAPALVVTPPPPAHLIAATTEATPPVRMSFAQRLRLLAARA
jgi:hypothetical protein